MPTLPLPLRHVLAHFANALARNAEIVHLYAWELRRIGMSSSELIEKELGGDWTAQAHGPRVVFTRKPKREVA